MNNLLFAIDFDGTWNEDPILFGEFYDMLTEYGHGCILVTQRSEEWNPEIREVIGDEVEILNCPGSPKVMATIAAGYSVDIWIENNPHAFFNALSYVGDVGPVSGEV